VEVEKRVGTVPSHVTERAGRSRTAKVRSQPAREIVGEESERKEGNRTGKREGSGREVGMKRVSALGESDGPKRSRSAVDLRYLCEWEDKDQTSKNPLGIAIKGHGDCLAGDLAALSTADAKPTNHNGDNQTTEALSDPLEHPGEARDSPSTETVGYEKQNVSRNASPEFAREPGALGTALTSPGPSPMVPFPPSPSSPPPSPRVKEHLTRTLFVGGLETMAKEEFFDLVRAHGEIRALDVVQRDAVNGGNYALLSFFDCRSAEVAYHALQEWHGFNVHFTSAEGLPGMENRGTLVVFNLDPNMGNEKLIAMFEVFGEIKEIRETPMKKNHKFIEFFDVRAAEAALESLNKQEVNGRRLKIEYSRPGGARRNQGHSMVEMASGPAPMSPVYAGSMQPMYMHAPMMIGDTGSPYGVGMGIPMGVSPHGLPMHPSMMWPQYPPMPSAAVPGYPPPMYMPGSPANSMMHSFSPPMTPPLSPVGKGTYANSPREYVSNVKNPSVEERPSVARKLREEKLDEQFVFRPEVADGESRTTLMIRNIPNKYNQKMLLSLLDRRHKNKFDFFYLPIDFKNKCNLGYAFVNFVSIEATVDFYNEFQEKRWEEFNSKKVCEISYARVQGKDALVEHFKNSRFPNTEEEYLPLVLDQKGEGMEGMLTKEVEQP